MFYIDRCSGEFCDGSSMFGLFNDSYKDGDSALFVGEESDVLDIIDGIEQGYIPEWLKENMKS